MLALACCSLLLSALQDPRLVVRIVDPDRHAVVADAELRFVPVTDPRLRQHVETADAYHAILREEFFTGDLLARSSNEGTSRLDPPEVPGFLCASRAGLRGCRYVPASTSGEFELPLVRDWALDVDVRDPSGAGLDGLGVCLRFALPGEVGFQDAPVTRVPIVAGRARVEHAGYYQGTCESGGAFYAGLTGWVGKPVLCWIPRQEPPSGRVELVLPPHGSLRVVLRDEDGNPATALDPLAVGERSQLPAIVAWPVAEPAGVHTGGQGWVARPLADGAATIAHVALGTKLVARVQRNNASEPTRIEFEGPKLAGETVRVPLQLGSGLVTLRGRMHMPPGLRLLQGWPADADGRFRVDLDAGRVRALKHHLDFTAAVASNGAEWHLWFEEDWKPGLQDLGEIVLEDPPLLAAGRVLDARTKQPLAGVELVLVSEWPEEHWATQADANGRFELRGHAWTEGHVIDVDVLRSSADGSRRATRKRLPLGARQLALELD